MAEIDRRTIEEVGISGPVLMERAGLKASEKADAILEQIKGSKVVILAGKGNNGGDGFVMARLLEREGYDVETYLIGEKAEIKGDARKNLDILAKLELPVKEIKTKAQLKDLNSSCQTADLIIDALLGTGIKGEPRGLFAPVIDMINQAKAITLAVDIPSGVEADTANVAAQAVKADYTVSFALPKLGLLLYPGADYTGQLEVVDIGISSQVITEFKAELITKEMAAGLLPKRKANTHKGDYGNLLLLAASQGMTGAASLSAKSALRMGVGLLTVGVPESLNHILETKLTEAMTYPLADKDGRFSAKAVAEIEEIAAQRDVIAFGPGLSSGEAIREIVRKLLTLELPLVIDADGLNALDNLELLRKRKSKTILTPHPGEFSRLTGLELEMIKKNPIKHAKEFAKKYQVVLILKDARSIIATPDEKLYLNQTGNSGLATGGSGDVLTGMVASLLAQGLKAEAAAVLGVYLHGLTADIASQKLTTYSLLPGDLIEYLSEAIKLIDNYQLKTKKTETNLIKSR